MPVFSNSPRILPQTKNVFSDKRRIRREKRIRSFSSRFSSSAFFLTDSSRAIPFLISPIVKTLRKSFDSSCASIHSRTRSPGSFCFGSEIVQVSSKNFIQTTSHAANHPAGLNTKLLCLTDFFAKIRPGFPFLRSLSANPQSKPRRRLPCRFSESSAARSFPPDESIRSDYFLLL